MKRGILTVLVVLAATGCTTVTTPPTTPSTESPASAVAVTSPSENTSEAATPSEPVTTKNPRPFDASCHSLSSTDNTNANQVGVLWQTYHSEGRPYSAPTKVETVDAGDGYWIFAAVIYGEKSAWLAWDNNEDAGDPPDGNFLHWSEIESLSSWDGGPTPHGVEALASALRCLR